MQKNRIGLLLIINRLQIQERALTRENILSVAEIKLPGVVEHYEELIRSLLSEGSISGDLVSFIMTSQGQEEISKVSADHDLVTMFYDEYYQAVGGSKAHSLFCEQVYGLDLAQHGIADMEQLGIMLEELEIEPGMNLLDFGCGDGRITEYLAGETSARIVGVDKAKNAIDLANQRTEPKRDQLEFFWADIEKGLGDTPPGLYDRILAIDSLMFVRDHKTIFDTLLSRLAPSGKMAIFLISHPDINHENHPVGKTMGEMGQPYQVIDLSYQNRQHWFRKKEVLLALEEDFKKEGSQFLFKNRLAECSGLEDFNRYLYLVDN